MAAGQLVTRQPGARLAAVGRAALREGAGQLRDGGDGGEAGRGVRRTTFSESARLCVKRMPEARFSQSTVVSR